jgi:hypothetical protein
MAKQHPPGTVRLRYLPLATPPVVGMLYRHSMCGGLMVVTAVQGAAVTLQTHGHHIHGAIKPAKLVRTVRTSYTPGIGLVMPSPGGNGYRRPVVPYTTA